LRKPGKQSNTDRIAAIAATVLFATILALPTCLFADDTFLLPGVTFSNADFTVGAWCRYTVVDELPGERDSTIVYIAITGSTVAGGGRSFWLELKTGPAHAETGEFEAVKALISYDIKNLQPGDSLCHYVSRLYIKKGTGPVETADPAELERLTSTNPTSDSDWDLSKGEKIETPGGSFLCDRKSRTVLDQREIPMGRTTLVKNDSDACDAWFCDEVPIFRLVRCVIERVRESKTVPSIPGIPDKGREVTRTTVELTEYGTDAKPVLNIE
jgi:hypothetical protein